MKVILKDEIHSTLCGPHATVTRELEMPAAPTSGLTVKTGKLHYDITGATWDVELEAYVCTGMIWHMQECIRYQEGFDDAMERLRSDGWEADIEGEWHEGDSGTTVGDIARAEFAKAAPSLDRAKREGKW